MRFFFAFFVGINQNLNKGNIPLSWNKKATIQIDKVTQVKHKITIKILVDKTRMTHKIKKNRTILKFFGCIRV